MRVVSGIRSSGHLHIGNYLGAIKQWIELQEKYECFFFVADLHAITTSFDPKILKREIQDTVISYLALGLNPEKATLFIQSQISEHTELCWILGCLTPLGELKRMTQFKEKAKEQKEVKAGLLNYPLLMAADILLYKADLVPVGKDQLQHVELTRDIAKAFNKKFGETFVIPKALLSKGEKIMSLQNPKKKMSKSGDEKECIFLFEEPEKILEKIKRAVTDSGKEIKYDPKRKPGISNLMKIYSLFSGREIKEIEKEFKGKTYYEFKLKLAEFLIEKLSYFKKKKEEFLKREIFIKEILEKGRKKAKEIAQRTMEEVRQKIGLDFLK
jgi:tryptophanyl-tRNA synthetase